MTFYDYDITHLPAFALFQRSRATYTLTPALTQLLLLSSIAEKPKHSAMPGDIPTAPRVSIVPVSNGNIINAGRAVVGRAHVSLAWLTSDCPDNVINQADGTTSKLQHVQVLSNLKI